MGNSAGGDATAPEKTAELQLAKAAEDAIAKALAASPQRRVKVIIEWAAGYLDSAGGFAPGASHEFCVVRQADADSRLRLTALDQRPFRRVTAGRECARMD